jgi:DNA-binding response OmpR family regulator
MLIVDDEESITFAMGEYFRAQGFAVDGAAEVEEAEALLTLRRYDAVVADLRLTGTSAAEGLAVVAMAREQHPAAAIVLMTAFGTPAVQIEARRRGADLVFAKPCALPSLAAEIVRVMGER